MLHAAHLKVMSQLTPEEAFFTGLVTNARPEAAGAERVYGVYLNPLPFAHRRGARTWRELVRQVFDQEIEVWPHRRYPLGAMQRELAGSERLVNVRFSYQNFRQVDQDLVDYPATIDDSPTEFPLGVSTRAGFMVITGHRHHFGRAAVDRLAAMYRAVLESMAADVDGDALETFLPAGERELVLTTWNDSTVAVAQRSVPELIAEQVARHPDAVAVESDGGGGVVRGAGRPGESPRPPAAGRAGVGPESSVAVLLDRSADLVVALLAVWRAGAGYVPMDPVLPAGRITDMVTDAGVQVAVTSAAYADRFEVPVVRVEDDFSRLPQSAPDLPVDLDTVAYTVFTSGSTGRPRACRSPTATWSIMSTGPYGN
ncbi:AMP-binding protein [Streptomyces thinghirensis]|nr:AMP-binding protein [Streptomyces thinghirensis]